MSLHSRPPKPLVALLWIAVTIGGASVIAFQQSDPNGRALRAAPDGDSDGDGIVNALDNCLVGANADQRDSDRDGVGNACDADFNNDGLVDQRDLSALTRAFGTNQRDQDLNGDGAVNQRDLRILLDLFKRGPGPRLDSDGDGVADLDDPCPGATPGVPSSVPGCTALALLQRPEAVLAPIASRAVKTADNLRASLEMANVRADLGLAAEDVIAAERVIRTGDVCRSSSLFAHGDERLAAALDSIDRQLADARARVGTTHARTASGPAVTAVDTAGDVSESDMLVVGLEYWREQVAGIRAWNRQGTAAFAAVCDASSLGTTRGVIKAVLDAERRIELTDGRAFVLAEPIGPAGELFPTRAVQVGGLMFADGNGYATAVGPDGPGIILPPSALIPCLKLRFAPVQRLPPVFAGPFVLHDPLGYKAAGVYNVESGMAVAAESNCSPGKGRSFPRYTLKVEISYQQKQTGAAIDHAIMAPELDASDAPVPFSTDVDPNVAATLHVTSQVQTCLPTKGSPQCTDPTGIEVDYPLMVRSRGALASASYEQTEFDVNDQIAGDFRLTHLSFFTALADVDDGTSQMFVAEGYGPFFDAVAETLIVNTDPFAIRNTDFVPIFPAFTLAEAVNEQKAEWLSGVDHPAGLRWPRVQGIRNGRAFWYSASLPSITRDVVNFCESPNAYYRLPFAYKNLNWVQGQGNHPELPSGTPGFTHSGGYAYDMIAPAGEWIRAARAGRVVKVDESNTLQCSPSVGCPPNNIFIKHQDGSIGEYVHMPLDGVIPEVGDLVKRGEHLAGVGTVGVSSGPHLHFATRTQPKPGGTTFLARFEALVWIPLDLGPEILNYCYVPAEQDILRSNNKPFP